MEGNHNNEVDVTDWVVVHPIETAQDATVLCEDSPVLHRENSDESDNESDGISVISETSHIHTIIDEVEELHENNSKKIEDIHPSQPNEITNESSQEKKWTFIDLKSKDIEAKAALSKKEFYLNCLQEPIQELSEQELGTLHSDIESDSISIISDCDSIYESESDIKDSLESNDKTIVVANEDNNIYQNYFLKFGQIKDYLNNGLLMGTLLLATTSIFVGQYFASNNPVLEDVSMYDEFNNDLNEKIKDVKLLDPALYCKELMEKDKIYMEYDKCIKTIKMQYKKNNLNNFENKLRLKGGFPEEKEININKKQNRFEDKDKETQLKIKEEYLSKKEQFLVQKEYELLKAEHKIKKENKKKHKLKELHNSEKDNKNNEFVNAEQNFKYNETYQKPKTQYAYKTKKFNRYSFDNNKSKEDMTKNFKLNHDRFKKSNNDNKINYYKDNSKENYHDKKLYYKKEKRFRHILNETEGPNNDADINSKWYFQLYKSRDNIRQKEHASDWLFDRASARSYKRNEENKFKEKKKFKPIRENKKKVKKENKTKKGKLTKEFHYVYDYVMNFSKQWF